MAKTKSRKKEKVMSDPKESEERQQTEHKKESIETQQQNCGSEEISSKRKKLKKEIKSTEDPIDSEVNREKDTNYEETEDKDQDVNEVENQKTKKSKIKKSKEKKIKNQKTEENGSEDKGIKEFNFGQSLRANIAAISGQKGLSLKRKTDNSTETVIDMTAEEWMAFKQVMPQIDDIINNNDN